MLRSIKDPERVPGNPSSALVSDLGEKQEQSRRKRQIFTVFGFTQLQEISTVPSPELRWPCHKTGTELEYFFPEWPKEVGFVCKSWGPQRLWGPHTGPQFSSQTLGSPHKPWVLLTSPGFAYSPEF